MTAWDVQSVQVVWWGLPSTIDVESLFTTAFGRAPTSVQKALQVHTVHSIDGDQILRLQFARGRLDFFINAQPKNDVIALLPFDRTIDLVLAYVDKLNGGLSANRLSVVIKTSKAMASSEEASSAALKLIGIELPFVPTSDVVFNLNLRKASSNAPCQINRNMRFQAEQYQFITVNNVAPFAKLANALSLTLDVNTLPVPNLTFSSDQQSKLLNELLTEARRLAQDQSPKALG